MMGGEKRCKRRRLERKEAAEISLSNFYCKIGEQLYAWRCFHRNTKEREMGTVCVMSFVCVCVSERPVGGNNPIRVNA